MLSPFLLLILEWTVSFSGIRSKATEVMPELLILTGDFGVFC